MCLNDFEKAAHSALNNCDYFLSFCNALAYGLLFVCNVWVVNSNVTLTVGSGSKARLGHFNLDPTVAGPFLSRPSLFGCRLHLLATDLHSLQIERLRDKKTKFFGDLLSVKLTVCQVKLFYSRKGALGLP